MTGRPLLRPRNVAADCDFTFSPPASPGSSFTLHLIDDGAGGRAATWPVSTNLRAAVVALALLAASVVAWAITAGLSRAWQADCWLYCGSKAPPKAFVEALAHVAKFSADHGVPVRTINALGGKLIGGGYAPGSEEFTASGTHLAKAGVITITVEVVGGGGGSGYMNTAVFGHNSAGGGGAGYSSGSLSVAPYQSITVTIGAAGAGGASIGASGVTGGTTAVDTISATGGTGGGPNTHVEVGGSGGSGSGGPVNRTGGNGAGADSMGGGGAGGPSGNGSNGSGASGGASGGAPGGAGGGQGVAGSNYGGGGGGLGMSRPMLK